MTSASSKRVLILELGAEGHHPFYVRWLLESGLADRAQIVLAALPAMFTHPAIANCGVGFEPYALEFGSAERLLWSSNPAIVARRSLAFGTIYRNAYLDLAARQPLDFVIVPYLDDCLLGLAARRRPFGRTPWLAITMRTMFHYGAMGVTAPRQRFEGVRRWLIYRLLRQDPTAALLTIDPTLADFASARHRHPSLRKVRYVPDPAPQHRVKLSQEEARQRLGIARAGRLVLVYGDISGRKGIFSLAQAAALAECPPQVHLLLAGRNRQTRELESTTGWQTLISQGRAHTIYGFIDDEHEGLLMRAADCMWVGYIDFYGVSSVMALAGRHGMPVIASNYGVVGYLAQKHDLGPVVDPHDPASIVAALQRLARDPEYFRRAGSHGISVFHNHAPTELQRQLIETIGQAWNDRASAAAREIRD
jgi:glycosyltransferase involved in cell wall biosynthesis